MTKSRKYPEATIFRSEKRTLYSKNVGMEYHLPVWFPPGYPNSQQSYPVVYVLDGSPWFDMASNETLALIYGGLIQEVMVVGINYPDSGGYEAWGRLRDLDLIPPDFGIDGAHAPQFLSFIKEELVPLIDHEYPTDPTNRALWGSSFGGFFTLYTLFHEPGLFSGYIAASAIWERSFAAYQQYCQALSGQKADMPMKLYLTVGGEELDQRTYFEEVCDLFRNGSFPALDFRAEVLEGEVHWTQHFRSFLNGIRWMYALVGTGPA